MTLENNVYEVGLDYLVDDGKRADYIGRDGAGTRSWRRA